MVHGAPEAYGQPSCIQAVALRVATCIVAPPVRPRHGQPIRKPTKKLNLTPQNTVTVSQLEIEPGQFGRDKKSVGLACMGRYLGECVMRHGLGHES